MRVNRRIKSTVIEIMIKLSVHIEKWMSKKKKNYQEEPITAVILNFVKDVVPLKSENFFNASFAKTL